MNFSLSPTLPGRNALIVLGVLILMLAAFSPCLDNGFTNWDDPEYVLENPLVRGVSAENLKGMFSTHLTGKYHPLTLLSYSLEYQFFQLTPRIYHLSNLLLHAVNVILAFCFLALIVQDIYIAAAAALLFAVHPVQVEAVAWVTGRKDLLCAAFSLLCLIMYIRHVREGAAGYFRYLAVFVLFALAMLSKAMAVTLPCILVLLDYYLKRKLDVRNLAEKAPFFALALGLGWRTWSAAQEANGFPVTALFTFTDRFFLSAHALFLYLVRIVFPQTISCFYPLPVKSAGSFAPGVYLSGAFALGSFVAIWFWGRKDRLPRFALLFFLVSLAPVLHLAQINDSITYDRFVYLGSLGVFLILALACRRLAASGLSIGRQVKFQRLATAVLPLYILYLSFFSWNRCHVWQNSFTLWTDCIGQFRTATVAYLNRGSYLLEDNKPELAILDAYAAVKFSPRYAAAYLARGHVFSVLGEDLLAIRDLDAAVRIDPSFSAAYFERGNARLKQRRYDLALKDFTDVIQLDAQDARAFANRGSTYLLLGETPSALGDYARALAIDPRYADVYFNRAMTYKILGDTRRARQDFGAVLAVEPLNAAARVARANLANEVKESKDP